MPLARLPIRSTDARAVFFQKGADSRMAVHGLEHFQAGSIDSHERKIVVERGEPPFIFVVLVGDEIGDMPSQKRERFSGETARFVKDDGWFHAWYIGEKW